MKYAVILYDGMADYPVDELGGKTPMMCAKKPVLDSLAGKGKIGLVNTATEGFKQGSDVANLTVLGYDPRESYSGRSPLEALSIGVDMLESDVALRCNLVSLSGEKAYEDKTMVDYSGGDISTQEAKILIDAVEQHFGNDIFKFYAGVQYRHCLIFRNGTTDLGSMTPPHDISGKVIGDYLSTSGNAKQLIQMMKESYELLNDHPLNLQRVKDGKLAANSIWLWGEGTKPKLQSFYDKYGLNGSIISAVDLLKGIGIGTKMSVPDVEGATGYIDTNFEGKANKAIEELDGGKDFVYVHFEAPDECGHRREVQNKIRSIELIDERVLPIIIKGLEKYDDYKILVLPDHPTPIVTATHARDPVPFMMYHKKDEKDLEVNFNEETAKNSGLFIKYGPDLMKEFLDK
ncbi:MAG: cofactor-independent phosphoglycerate mutase [Clostridia bacterium]|nr:cofactor-independent phosphoglycerate mutase [Clostridia bacterium]